MRAPQDDEESIRQLITTWLEATRAKDTKKVLSLMADDVVFLQPGKQPMRGKSEFAEEQSQLKDLDFEANSEIKEIRIFGEWAYIWTALSIVVTPRDGGKPMKRSGNTLSILQKRAGDWLLYRDANLLAADQ